MGSTAYLRATLVVMADRKPQPTQKSQPKKGKPIDIPVPKRSDFDKLLKRAEKSAKPKP
jgi:hypothetical protein